MSKTVVQVFCEWDIGQEYVVFTNTKVAREWAREQLKLQDFEESLEELEGENLVGYNHIDLVGDDDGDD